MATSYRNAGSSAKGGRALPLTLAGLIGVALWQNRDKVGPLVQSLRDKVGGLQGGAPRTGTDAQS